MSWKIDESSGYCKSDFGTEVILADCHDGQYRFALGPFTSDSCPMRRVATDILLLKEQVETNGVHLLFGSLSNKGEFSQTVAIKGRTFPWVPDPSARTHWLIEAGNYNYAMEEWSGILTGLLHHKAGIAFDLSGVPKRHKKSLNVVRPTVDWQKTSEFSESLWPNLCFDDAIHSLANAALRLHSQFHRNSYFPQLASYGT